MGIAAIYTFEDARHKFHVYKHWENYPEKASKYIDASKCYTWNLPKFDAGEFSCAFIAANKAKDGFYVRLCGAPEDFKNLYYRYEISSKGKKILVKAFRRTWKIQDLYDSWEVVDYKEIFNGTLEEFLKFEDEREDDYRRVKEPDRTKEILKYAGG